MNDLASWSLPLGRFFGISVRVHLFLLLFSVFEVLRVYTEAPRFIGVALLLQLLLFAAILTHEFGHCFAARHVDGDADEILMWPLGGLAYCQTPNTPWAHFFTAAGGPAINFFWFMGCLGGLTAFGLAPPLSPLWDPYTPGALYSWFTGENVLQLTFVQQLLARFFWVNWLLFWFNILLVGFPLDGGRLLQAALWPRYGFHSSMRVAVYAGYAVCILLCGLAFVFHKQIEQNSLMLFALALFIFLNCRQQQQQLELGGMGDDSLFGYDFSQGYTSLERTQPPTARRAKQSFWKRWLAKRAEARKVRQEQQEQADQTRLDQLLAKIAAEGNDALTPEEQRFLKRMSAKFRNKSKQ